MHDGVIGAGIRAYYLRLVTAAVLLVPLAAYGQVDEQHIDLQPDWREGQTCRYEFWNSRRQNTTMEIAGRQREMSNTLESEGEITWRVDRVRPDGSATCSMTLDWIAITVTDPDGEEQYSDSRRGSGDIESLHQLLRAMSGRTLVVEVASDGSISSISGRAQIARAVDQPEIVPEDLDFIESASDLATLSGAPAGIEPGGSWKVPFKWNHDMGFMHYETTYTLDGIELIADIPIATVTGRSKLKLEYDDSDMPPGSPPVDVDLISGSQESQIIYDLSRHEAVGRNTVETQTINMSIRFPQQTFSRLIEQEMQGQVLRIEEE